MASGKASTRKRKKNDADEDGDEIGVTLGDILLLLKDFELFSCVDKAGEIVLVADLPDEPKQSDLDDARKLRDALDDIVSDLEEELGGASHMEDDEGDDDEEEPESDEEEEDEDDD